MVRINEEEAKRIVEELRQELGIEETPQNYVTFMNLRDNIIQFGVDAQEAVTPTSDCDCDCDSCEDCDYK